MHGDTMIEGFFSLKFHRNVFVISEERLTSIVYSAFGGGIFQGIDSGGFADSITFKKTFFLKEF